MGNALDARSAREALIVEALRGVDTVLAAAEDVYKRQRDTNKPAQPILLSTLSHLCLVSHPLVRPWGHTDPWMNQTSLTIAITTQVAMASFARRSVIQR